MTKETYKGWDIVDNYGTGYQVARKDCFGNYNPYCECDWQVENGISFHTREWPKCFNTISKAKEFIDKLES